MFVVIWEPKRGNGGGHQLVADAAKVEAIRHRISREKPDHLIRIDTAEAYGAAAVAYRGQSYRYG
jgi:hypothetical protein